MCPSCWKWSIMWLNFTTIKQWCCNSTFFKLHQSNTSIYWRHNRSGEILCNIITEGKVNTWYVASCEGKNSDGTYEMDHLTRVQRGHNLKWKYPVRLDKVNLRAESIIECVVDSEWDVSHERNMTFILRNHVYISNFVQKLFIW